MSRLSTSVSVEKRGWDDDAERGLDGAYGEVSPHEIAQMVDAGTCELWRVNGDSWLVTGIEKDESGRLLFVWSYAGKNLCKVGHTIIRIARHNGLQRIQFVSLRKSVARLLSCFSPVLKTVTTAGAQLYEIGV